MTRHNAESLEKQLGEIDRLMNECRDNPNLSRLEEHLRGRREVTVQMIEKMKGR